MLPLNHVFGFVCGLLWGMECGAAVALGRGARYYTRDFEFYRPTALSAVPLLLSFLVQHKLMNSELRLVLVGAGDCSPQLLNSAVQQGVQVSFGYGLTETSSGVAISVPGSPSFDPFALEVCPEDTVALASDGEILISSPSCMMKGYYKHPEDTAAVLKGNLLFTGDIGKWDENGRLHVIGRKKEILVLADGTKIFLPEYEARIMTALPGRDFTVLERNGKPVLLLVDKESSTWPEEMRELSRSVVQEELRGAMSQLPRGQQLSEILFTDKPLPRTATGKVKRWEIHCP
jgi:long-subunit acyl-CoA synthetase (AMP-forming)